jgi:hypothetical protein
MMRSAAISLLVVALFLGCRSGGRTEDPASGARPADSSAGRSAGAPEATTEPTASARTESTPRGYRKLDFSVSNVPTEFSYEGRITDGARWSDANGENTLLVTEKKVNRGPDDSVHFIYGYLFAIQNGSVRLLWMIQDNAENYCDNGKGLTSPIEVRDIDEDGIAENMFVYNIAGGCDVSPIPYKLMMHSGEKKLAIRGTNSVEVPDCRQRGEKNFDDAFNSSPRQFRDAASQVWDRHVAPFRAD